MTRIDLLTSFVESVQSLCRTAMRSGITCGLISFCIVSFAQINTPALLAQETAEPPAELVKSPAAETTSDVAEAVPEVVPFQLRPYRVRVELACSGLLGTLDAEPDQLRADVVKAVQRMYGQMWMAEVGISEWLIPGTLSRLQRLTSEQLLERYPETLSDKILLVGMEQSAGGWLISCREYDTRIQELAPVRTSKIDDVRLIAQEATRLMRDSFRPVLMLSAAVQGSDELEFFLQAGELPPPDPSAAQIAEGDILRPFLRHMERREPEKLRMLQRLDLTYIRVTEFDKELTATGISADDIDVTVEGSTTDSSVDYVDRGRVKGVLISHGNAPYGGRGRSVEQIALRQRPLAERSRVKLVLNARQDRPLICHRVDKVAKLRWRDESLAAPERMVSDRNGEVEISVDAADPTFWLYVYSGSLLLARVPYAPGLLEFDTIKLPDDSIRLAVEGELYLFRDQLVDVVAQRAVLNGIAKQAATSGNLARLEEILKELDALPAKKEFDSMLNAIRVPAVNRAKQLRNRSAERLVDRLCNDMANSVGDFFSSEKRTQELEQIQQLRRIAEQSAATGRTTP